MQFRWKDVVWAWPWIHSWGVVIDSKLLRKKLFQAARQSWHRFKRFCVELLGETMTHQQLGTLPRNGNARKGYQDQSGQKGDFHKIQQKEKGDDPKQQLLENGHTQGWTYVGNPTISTVLTFRSLLVRNVRSTANLMRMTQTQVLYRSFAVSGRGSDAPNSDATPVRLSTRIYTKLLVGLQMTGCRILCQSMSIFVSWSGTWKREGNGINL